MYFAQNICVASKNNSVRRGRIESEEIALHRRHAPEMYVSEDRARAREVDLRGPLETSQRFLAAELTRLGTSACCVELDVRYVI